MDLHLLVCWCFMLVMSGLMTSHALSHGPGRCWNTISALITVRETFTESMTKRTATCCDWFCTSKCSSYRVVYRTAYRNALRAVYKIDLGCCPGWRPQEGHCVPASIPDGRAEATLVPFQPGGPPGEPRVSRGHQADTGTSSGAPGNGNSYLGQGFGKDQQAGSTGGTKAVNSEPRLPSRGAPHEGDVYVIKKSRSDVWATSHPVEMSAIVGMLGIVVVVILVGWTMYKRRLTRDHPVMIQLYKAEERPGTCEAGAFQYEVLPKTDARTSTTTQQVQTATAPSIVVLPEEHIYQNFPLFKSRALRINKNIVLMATQQHRGSVYEVNLPDGATSQRYTMLNVGDRQSSASYTPLQLENVNIPSTSKEGT